MSWMYNSGWWNYLYTLLNGKLKSLFIYWHHLLCIFLFILMNTINAKDIFIIYYAILIIYYAIIILYIYILYYNIIYNI